MWKDTCKFGTSLREIGQSLLQKACKCDSIVSRHWEVICATKAHLFRISPVEDVTVMRSVTVGWLLSAVKLNSRSRSLPPYRFGIHAEDWGRQSFRNATTFIFLLCPQTQQKTAILSTAAEKTWKIITLDKADEEYWHSRINGGGTAQNHRYWCLHSFVFETFWRWCLGTETCSSYLNKCVQFVSLSYEFVGECYRISIMYEICKTTGGSFMNKRRFQFFMYRALRVAILGVFLVTQNKLSVRSIFSAAWLSPEWFT